jgi:hypothetical protein
VNPSLRWRAEFYKPGNGPGVETVVGHVDGDAKTVALAVPPEGALSRLKLITPPDIRLDDYVRYDNGEDESFVAVVTRVGKPYESGTFNVDLRRGPAKSTVFCENCTVVFRPHPRCWKEGEVFELFPKQSEVAVEETLVGRNPEKTVVLTRDYAAGSWTISFRLGETKVDGKTCSEKEYGALRNVVRAANAWIFEEPVKIGDYWTMTINQGRRDVEVVAVKKLRYRIEYEMPNAGMMGSWQTGVLIDGKLYA